MTVLVGYVPTAEGEAAFTAALQEAGRRNEPLVVLNSPRSGAPVRGDAASGVRCAGHDGPGRGGGRPARPAAGGRTPATWPRRYSYVAQEYRQLRSSHEHAEALARRQAAHAQRPAGSRSTPTGRCSRSSPDFANSTEQPCTRCWTSDSDRLTPMPPEVHRNGAPNLRDRRRRHESLRAMTGVERIVHRTAAAGSYKGHNVHAAPGVRVRRGTGTVALPGGDGSSRSAPAAARWRSVSVTRASRSCRPTSSRRTTGSSRSISTIRGGATRPGAPSTWSSASRRWSTWRTRGRCGRSGHY